jgi:AraC-like DNA-binding protein
MFKSNNKQNSSYFAPGLVIAYGKSIDAKPHKHSLWQLCLPSEESKINEEILLSGQVISPNELHQLSMPKGWVILAEPSSQLGKVISELPSQLPMVKNEARIDELFNQLYLFPTLIEALKNNPYNCGDKRIIKLLAQLDTCSTGKCLKPAQWRAKDIADQFAISESRFLHLVRKELGVSWRPYLLWRRLLCAIKAIKSGKNMTESAYLAGFSDSAHLCRTIKSLFGMTSKQLLSSFK